MLKNRFKIIIWSKTDFFWLLLGKNIRSSNLEQVDKQQKKNTPDEVGYIEYDK